jgi:uncharacterized membrane protein
MQEQKLTFGPVQMLSIAFDGNHFKGELLPELERLKVEGLVRIVDMLVVRKDSTGSVATLTATDLDWEEATQYGAYVGTLIGFGAGGIEGADRGAIAGAAEFADGHLFNADDAWKLTNSVPDGTTIAIVLLEHLWALPLLGAIERADGVELSNDWVQPEDLVELGIRRTAGFSDDAPRI